MSITKETILDVAGMTCCSCIRHVEGALREIEGISAIDVAINEGKVRVEHDERATIAQMIDALGEAGYESRAAGR